MTPKRKHRRVPLYVPAKLWVGDAAFEGWTHNVSEGGMGLRLGRGARDPNLKTLPVDVDVSLEFQLPGEGDPIRIQGHVLWQGSQADEGPDLGVYFRPGQEAALRIRAWAEAFRYRVAALDCHPPELPREALSDLFDVRILSGERELEEDLESSSPALILLGESPDRSLGLDRLERLLIREKSWAPPVVYFVAELDDRLRHLAITHPRLLHQRLPIDAAQLRAVAERLVERHQLSLENERLTSELETALERLRIEGSSLKWVDPPRRLEGLIGGSPAMLRLYADIERVAKLDTTVLLDGETGTGKSMVARVIHNLSRRAGKMFVAQNCGALPETLLDAELFGHTRGAFTGAVNDRAGLFEAAHGGTLFLDEIGEMSLPMQAKLLGVLQEREVRPIGATSPLAVDVRVVCATNQNLQSLIRQGKFREDLYYRLSAFPLELPPLRERKEDIGPLAVHFLEQFVARNGIEQRRISVEAIAALESYPWPGNVRELQNVIERLAIICPHGGKISASLVGEVLKKDLRPKSAKPQSIDDALISYERALVTEALEQAGWVIADAARMLRLNRTTLSRRLRRLGISVPDQGSSEPG